MTMQPRISLLTLGVDSVEHSTAFYEKLGFKRASQSVPSCTFFQLGGGLVLALYSRDCLAHDAGLPPSSAGSPSAMTIAYNTRSQLEVDKLMAAFVAAGGRLLKAPFSTEWGGYLGYVADPDGHVWEICHNPHFAMDDSGGLVLP